MIFIPVDLLPSESNDICIPLFQNKLDIYCFHSKNKSHHVLSKVFRNFIVKNSKRICLELLSDSPYEIIKIQGINTRIPLLFFSTARRYGSAIAYGLSIFLVFSTVWVLVRLSTKRMTREKIKLESLLNEKIEDIEKKKEKIQNQADRLQELYNTLLENSKFKEGMTSMIVHDLKNPLNSILSVPINIPPEQQLQSIRQSAKHMLNLVLNILDVNKYQKSKMELQLKASSLFNILDLALNQIFYLATQKNILVKTGIMEDYIILVDPEIFERVFINLLTNAIKYTPTNGTITIESIFGDSSDLYIRVIDTGSGIPREKEDLVFSEFGQLLEKKAGDVRSTGLGLTFCKIAVEAHGGKIGFDANDGGGTIFWFTVQSERVITQSGIKNKESLLKQADPENGFKEEDMVYLSGFISRLNSVKLYQISKIRRILSEINENSDDIKRWKEKILDASYSNNENLYHELLKTR